MTFAEHIAEAVLDLLKSIPSPDKADLEVCIQRAEDDYMSRFKLSGFPTTIAPTATVISGPVQIYADAPSQHRYVDRTWVAGRWGFAINQVWNGKMGEGELSHFEAVATDMDGKLHRQVARLDCTLPSSEMSKDYIDEVCAELEKQIAKLCAKAEADERRQPNQEGQ